MNVFSYDDYRLLLRALVAERKQAEPAFGFHKLADAARIQRPYLSKALKGGAQLSSDQLYLIALLLRLTADEREHLLLLLERDRTSIDARRKEFDKRLAQTRAKNRDTAAHLDAKPIDAAAAAATPFADYYLDPLNQIVHIAISVEAFSRNPAALAAELQISGSHLHAVLSALERMGLAYRDKGRILPREPSIHLPKASALYRAWRNQLKLLSLQRVNRLEDAEAYAFSTVFSAEAATQSEIHDRFLAFLKSCEGSVRGAAPKQVFQMSFDLFPWTAPRF